MHQEGYMKSIGDCYCYRCKSTSAEDLNEKAKSMEKELNEWTGIAENAREEYYPLNSFTNKQLCLLRKELFDPQKLTSEVKFLFTALLPCTPWPDIIEAIHDTRQQPLKFSTATDSDQTLSTKTKMPPRLDKSEQKLDLKQLVESSALKQHERDIFMNMTEQGTIPLVTLLLILRNRRNPKSELKLNKMINQYEDIRLGPWMESTKFEEICKEINELLLLTDVEQSTLFLLNETEDKVVTCDETVSIPITVSKSSSSMVDLSQSRYELL